MSDQLDWYKRAEFWRLAIIPHTVSDSTSGAFYEYVLVSDASKPVQAPLNTGGKGNG